MAGPAPCRGATGFRRPPRGSLALSGQAERTFASISPAQIRQLCFVKAGLDLLEELALLGADVAVQHLPNCFRSGIRS